MSVEDYLVSFSLEVNIDHAEKEVRRLETVLYRTLSIVQKLVGSEDLTELIRVSQKAIVYTNRLRLALLALQAARMAAGDPLAWALGGIAVAELGMSVASEFEMRSPAY